MSTTEAFSSFVEGLSTAEKETLGASLLLVAPALCMADDSITLRELIAATKGTIAGAETLGPGLGLLLDHGKNGADQFKLDMQRQLVALREKTGGEQPSEQPETPARVESLGSVVDIFTPQLVKARTILEKMPADLRGSFDDYIATLLLRVAEASGGFLWWGEKINAQEREAAQGLLGALGVTVRDPETRKKFGL